MQNRCKIAVCFSGYPRFYDRIDLKDYGNNISVFFHSWSDKSESADKDSCVSAFTQRQDYLNYKADNDVVKYLSPKQYKIESYKEKNSYFENMYSRFRNCEGRTRRSVFPMYYSMNESIKLALDSKEKFDIIVRTRFDLKLEQRLKFILDDNLHIPDQFHYFGFCDQFAYGPPALMKKYAETYDYIKTIPDIQLNPEIILKKHLYREKVEVSLCDDWFYLLR